MLILSLQLITLPSGKKLKKCIFRAVDSFSKRKYPVKIWCTRKIHNRQWLNLHWIKIYKFCGEYGIIMGKSSNYYPQGNGLAESTNKTLIQIIKKTIEANHKNWHNKLIDALWASCLTPKDSIGHSPYTLVYGKEAILPLHLELNALALIGIDENEEEQSPMQKRYNELLQLEEQREQEILEMKKDNKWLKYTLTRVLLQSIFKRINWFFYGTKKKKNHLSTQNLKLFGLAHIILKRLLVTIHTC
jgi:hypothetical protein